MYFIFGFLFGILAILCTVAIFKTPTDKMVEPNISLFVIITALSYSISIVSFGIESICNRLDDIKNRKLK